MTVLTLVALTAGPARAETREARLDALGEQIRAHHGKLTPTLIETMGRSALAAKGDARFYSAWRVLNYYRNNGQDADFARWGAQLRTAAARDGEPRLAGMVEAMTLSAPVLSGRADHLDDAVWSRFDAAGPDVRRVAQLERLRVAVALSQWANASTVGTALIRDVDGQNPLTWPLAAEAHTLLSTTLGDLGDHVSALDHMTSAAALDRKIGSATQDAERVYDLASMASAAGEYAAAQRLAALHGEVIKTSGGPRALFFNRYLCASIAFDQAQWPRVLRCLDDIAPLLDRPEDGWAVAALRLRLEVKARLGDAKGARRDFARLRAAPDGLGAEDPLFDLFSDAYILRAEKRGLEAFDVYDRWRRKAMLALDEDHQHKIADISSALQAELGAKRERLQHVEKEAALQRGLNTAWTLVAGLMTLLAAGGAAWVVHQRRVSRQLREARARAEAASEAKSTFLATMSHELRTPLNGMLGLAQALKLEPLEPGEREQVELLEDSGRNLLTLLNDVLDLSKIEAGKLDIAPIPGDLVHTCTRAARLHGALAADKGLAISFAAEGDTPASLSFDPVRVRQCVSNLLSNAVKFTAQGEVAMTLRCEPLADGDVLATIRVADSGVGMSAETLSRLFGAYVQADAATAREFGGTGLGLNITRRLAEMMGGGVTVESQEGVGSTFTLSFRCGAVAVEAPQAEAEEDAPAPFDLQGRKVLLVDDHPVNRKVVGVMLAPFGCVVVEAEHGQAALDRLETEAFDVVLMDVNMPVMDGLEATRRIRARSEWAALPVIALTADVMDDQIRACREAGMDDFVVKPVDMAALVSAVTRAGRTPVTDHEAGQDVGPGASRARRRAGVATGG
ncbi:response regulator [Caulobacter sp. BK020]|uniref:hybrid sensor histidine kinase/response regulator n=1 Tax=Caulobacter sp. BK020 TaxID=2512117 RepID=UPI001FB3785E|nr:response regulator [Caulobacter sp. BK020]